jgi:hypothetical protein
MWLASRVPALDEVAEFNMKFAKALLGGTFMGIDPQQVNALTTMIPGIGSLMERMAAEGRKFEGTPLSTTSVLESVKSSEQVQGAQQQSGGGGLGGKLARRLAGGSTTPRTKALTTTHDVLSIAPSAAAEDVAIPAGFKERK